jgi:hypothetical protein
LPFDLGYDESGADDTLLVTMQVAITEQAKKLKRRWRRELDCANVEFFHAVEFDRSSGVFAGMRPEKRLELLHTLALLNERYVSIGMTAKVTKSVFASKTTQQFRSKWGTAYTFAIQMLVVGAYLFAEHMGYRPEFNILIEGGHKNAGGAIESLSEAKKAGMGFAIPSRLLTIEIGSKQHHPILQSADMLAYSEWQHMNDRDMTIYNAMHSPTLRFQPEFLDFDDEMVDVVVTGAEEWMAKRKAWGQKKFATKASDV